MGWYLSLEACVSCFEVFEFLQSTSLNYSETNADVKQSIIISNCYVIFVAHFLVSVIKICFAFFSQEDKVGLQKCRSLWVLLQFNLLTSLQILTKSDMGVMLL
jgi:hypothetical protein